MKKLFLGLFCMLVLLPSLSFGAVGPTIPTIDPNPALTAFDHKQDADRIVFAQQQAQERAAFIKANQAIFDKQAKHGQWVFTHKTNKGMINDSVAQPPDLQPSESSIITAFMQKQRSECQAFAQQQAKARQQYLGTSS